MSCEVPQIEAPDLFGITTEPHYHCYVKKQPTTPEETERMLATIRGAEANCIRYRGTDPALFTRISASSASGKLDVCDHDPPSGTELGLRIHVTFRLPDSERPNLSALVIQFKKFLKARHKQHMQMLRGISTRLFPLKFRWWPPRDAIVFSLFQGFWNTVRVEVLESAPLTVHVYCDDTTSVPKPGLIAQWLETLPEIQDIRWYTEEGWSTTGTWHSSHC